MQQHHHSASLYPTFSKIQKISTSPSEPLTKPIYKLFYKQGKRRYVAPRTVCLMTSPNKKEVIKAETQLSVPYLSVHLMHLADELISATVKEEHAWSAASNIVIQSWHVTEIQSNKELDRIQSTHLSLSPLFFWSKSIKATPTKCNSNSNNIQIKLSQFHITATKSPIFCEFQDNLTFSPSRLEPTFEISSCRPEIVA